MKTLTRTCTITLATLAVVGVQAQSKYGATKEDSVTCVQNLSMYQEFVKQDAYNDAYNPWKEAVRVCPTSSKGLYQNGVKLISSFIEKEKDATRKARLIDSLYLVYDLRITHFGEKPFVLGRKGVDMMVYSPEKCQEAFDILKQSVDLGGVKSEAGTLSGYYQALNCLYGKGAATKEQMLTDYVTIMGHIEANLAVEGLKETTKEYFVKARDQVNNIFFKVAECGDIGRIVGDMITE